MFSKVNEKADDNSSLLRNMKVNMDQLAHKSATREMLKRLEAKIDEFSSFDHVKKLKTVWLPKFTFFGEKIDFFMEELDIVKQTMAKLDVALNLKLNKSHIFVVEN